MHRRERKVGGVRVGGTLRWGWLLDGGMVARLGRGGRMVWPPIQGAV